MSQSFTVTLTDDEVTAATHYASLAIPATTVDGYMQDAATRLADSDVSALRSDLLAQIAASMKAMTLAEAIAFAATAPVPPAPVV